MRKSESLYFRYAFRDLARNKGVNAALLVILVLSAFLMATGSMVMERLVGSVDQLFDEAKPPHFLQMHKGEYDPAALEGFAAENSDIDAWLVEDMLGFDSAAIAWQRPASGESGDLSESLIDNLFVTQNREFDFLVDGSGGIPQPRAGEVYVPVAYEQKFGLQIGDELGIRTDSGIHELRVRGFVKDAQMASSLSSATRFLVADSDFDALGRAGGGAPEMIVEYRLADPASASEFQRAYEADEALPKNGQAVTFQMIRMINAFSDGLVAIALVFVSLLLIAIALLNLRFVIRGTLEDEVLEIGALKAIGIPSRQIAGLYLAKYAVMAFISCLVGGVLAVLATGLLTRGIQVNYATAPVGPATFLIPLLALTLDYVIVVVVCRGVLGKVKRVEVVNAMVHGSLLDERQTARRAARQTRRVRRSSLASYRGRHVSRRLALLELRADAGQWVLIPIVFFLATLLLTLPANLLSTFESPRFGTYMGAPQSDLRADLQFAEDVDTVREDLLSAWRAEDRLSDVRAFANVLYEARGGEGWENLRVEVGDYSGDTVEFLRGGPPEPGQIALSVLNASRYGLEPGDTLTIRRDGEMSRTVVSGIYQDVTSGGYTAKLHGRIATGANGYVIYANAVEGTDPEAVAAEYGERFSSATVIPMREYLRQTLSYVTGAFKGAAIASLVVGVSVAALITILFVQLRLTRERQRMGVLSAIGFSVREIIAQLRLKTLVTVTAGTVLGLVVAATAGEFLVGLLIAASGLGIAQLSFIPNVPLVYVAYPSILIAAGYLAVTALTARLRGADTSLWLKAV